MMIFTFSLSHHTYCNLHSCPWLLHSSTNTHLYLHTRPFICCTLNKTHLIWCKSLLCVFSTKTFNPAAGMCTVNWLLESFYRSGGMKILVIISVWQLWQSIWNPITFALKKNKYSIKFDFHIEGSNLMECHAHTWCNLHSCPWLLDSSTKTHLYHYTNVHLFFEHLTKHI